MSGFKAEKIRSEMPSLHIKHPVTKAVFARFDSVTSDHSANFPMTKVETIALLHEQELRRAKLIAYMNSLGLTECKSKEDLSLIRQRILDYWETRPDADSFDDLVVMRNHMITASQIADQASWYFSTMDAANELGYGHLPVNSWSPDDFRQLSEYNYERRKVSLLPKGLNKHNAQLRLRHHIHEPQVEEEKNETKWGKQSVEYARDAETAVLSELFHSLVKETKTRFGTDILTSNAVVLTPEVNTFEDAQRFSRQLPPELARLFPQNENVRDEVMEMPDYSTNIFYSHPNLLETKARHILGKQDIQLPQDPKAGDIVALQKSFYPVLVEALGKAVKSYHPDVEKLLMLMASTSLTEGNSYALQLVGYNEFERYKVQKPLAEYIPEFRELAFRRGIDLSPLTRAIEIWIKNNPIDRDVLCTAIDKAFKIVGPLAQRAAAIQIHNEYDPERRKEMNHLMHEKEELLYRIDASLRSLGIIEPWAQNLRQILFNTGIITDHGYYLPTNSSVETRMPFSIEEIKNEIMNPPQPSDSSKS